MKPRSDETQGVVVRSQFPLTEDQRARFLWYLQGEGRIDHRNRYRIEGETHELAAVHVLRRPLPHVSNGETRMDGLDDLVFATPPCLYLQSGTGEIHGWKRAREELRSSWHCGVILADSAGDLWFCGRDQADGSQITADAPILRRISARAADRVCHENGELSENLPAEGEFWITEEDPGTVTLITWWSRLDAETMALNPDDRALINAMVARADAAGLGRDPIQAEDDVAGSLLQPG